ncbi:Calx-beta domain-containing protein [Candidatus Venteria ishoeyi]|uniref:Calx-beta domain protein n=1 Tax=Candidatus Venteria ishoeyi TaxID=1899563 RepID=A0A1H6F9J3_9GAMM|nr:Calx-beta domain-containing protein [Candidatus Venteria ishoeyi]SEH06758.1 Calx-beta domain protein [Candidatus Venteria ishoeyi]
MFAYLKSVLPIWLPHFKLRFCACLFAALCLLIWSSSVAQAAAGSIQFVSGSYSVNEDNGSVTISVSRASGSDGAVSVPYVKAVGGSATAGSDFSAVSGTLNWADGDSGNKSFQVPISNDSLDESNETFAYGFAASPSGGASLGSPMITQITIIDDDEPPQEHGVLQYHQSSYSINENAAYVILGVMRTNGSDGAVSVPYIKAVGGSATAGSDFTAVSGTLNWADGDSSTKTFQVPIINDSLEESNENFAYGFADFPSGGATQGATAITNITIIDDDEPPPEHGVLQYFQSSYTVNESAGSVTLSVTRTNGSDGAVSVPYVAATGGDADAGSDYTAVSGTLSWADGDSSSKSFQVPIINDSAHEGNESFAYGFADFPSGGATQGPTAITSIAIIDNDDPLPGSLQFTQTDYSINEGAGALSIQVSRTGGSDNQVSVGYQAAVGGAATPDVDYTAVSGSLSWADGDSSNKSFQIPITNDDDFESNESFAYALVNATGGAVIGTPLMAQILIVDNDDAVAGSLQLGSASYSIIENAGNVSITVLRTDGADGQATATFRTESVSATAGSDYTALNQSVAWSHGDSTSKTINVPVHDDSLVEANETFLVKLENINGAQNGSPLQATVTIIENDEHQAGSLQFQQAVYQVYEASGQAVIHVVRVNGADGAAAVSYASRDADAVANSDYTPVSGALSWADGDATSRTITVPLLSDGIPEDSEHFWVELSNVSGATLGSHREAYIDISDNDALTDSVQFTQNEAQVNESTGILTLTVSRSGTFQGALSVDYELIDGTAVITEDYEALQAVPLRLEWTDGDNTDKSFSITLADDGTVEGDEDFSVRLLNPQQVLLGENNIVQVSILDHNPVSTILQFAQASYQVGEDDGEVVLQVTRSADDGNYDTAVAVAYDIQDADALAGEDFQAVASGTLNWVAGDSEPQSISITLIDDAIIENYEHFLVNLQNPDNAILGSIISAYVDIQDNDVLVLDTLQFVQSSYSVDETTEYLDLAVSRTGTGVGAVEVSCNSFDSFTGSAQVDKDYLTVNTTLFWADGETGTITITVPIINDDEVEEDERFTVMLNNVTGAVIGEPGSIQVTIHSEDSAPQWSASAHLLQNATGDILEVVLQPQAEHYNTRSNIYIAASYQDSWACALQLPEKTEFVPCDPLFPFVEKTLQENLSFQVSLDGLDALYAGIQFWVGYADNIDDLMANQRFMPVFEIPPVPPQPITATIQYTPESGRSIQFDASASTGNELRFDWDFGDAQHSTEISPLHEYAKDGHYAVVLTVTDYHQQQSIIAAFVDIQTPQPQSSSFNVETQRLQVPAIQVPGAGLFETVLYWEVGSMPPRFTLSIGESKALPPDAKQILKEIAVYLPDNHRVWIPSVDIPGLGMINLEFEETLPGHFELLSYRSTEDAVSLLDGLKAELEKILYNTLQSNLQGVYQNGQKYLAFISGGVGKFIGMTLYIDMADYFALSPEGQRGWVTLWIDGVVGIGISPPLHFGLVPLQFTPTEQDPLRRYTAALATIPALGITGVSSSDSQAALQWGNPREWISNIRQAHIAEINASASLFEFAHNLLRLEIRKSVLDGLLHTALSSAEGQLDMAALNEQLYPALISLIHSNPDTGEIEITTPDTHRYFSSSDSGPSAGGNLGMITQVYGGIDDDLDGYGDLHYPIFSEASNRGVLLNVVMQNNGGNTRHYSIKVENMPEGWFIYPYNDSLKSELYPRQIDLDGVKPKTSATAQWLVGAYAHAPQTASLTFKLYQNRQWPRSNLLLDTLENVELHKYTGIIVQ